MSAGGEGGGGGGLGRVGATMMMDLAAAVGEGGEASGINVCVVKG